MAASDVCPTEDAVQAFLEYLVDPVLPAKSSSRDTPSESQQQSVAKQVQSVVLLYNCYHRKQNPNLEFLDFDAFCKLAVVLKPTLLAHMKHMQKSDTAVLDDVEKQLSLTEKKVMDACDICRSLDASRDVPNIEGWHVSKVAVLLIDAKKENCLLLFSSITQGVWSVIEKGVDISNQSSGVTSGARYTYKKKRSIKNHSKDELSTDEAVFLQVGYSAIKEAAGIDQVDLMVLDSHLVYSHTKEKAAARFYIMQCSQSVNEEVIQVPIRDAISRYIMIEKVLADGQLPLLVEYFHVLPYAEIVSDWLSREAFSNSLQDSRMAEQNTTMDNPERRESHGADSMENGPNKNARSSPIESPKQIQINESCRNGFSDSLKGPQNMDVDDFSIVASYDEENCGNIANPVQIEDQDIIFLPCANASNGLASDVKVEKVESTERLCITQCGPRTAATRKKICENTSSGRDGRGDDALVTYQSSSKYPEKLQIALASKEKILSQTALRALMRKRNNLSLQQRIIEDEIALCDKNIQTILNGGEDDLALKLESIIEGCNDVCLRTQEKTYRHLECQESPQYIKRKKLSEAVLSMLNPCQELDGLCQENNWILPTYSVSLSDGGFQANVTAKGVDFEYSCGGDLCSNPHEARESAAGHMLVKLRSMVNPTR
ncbi:Aleurone layer morphogenesis protein [Quillaja saponaria]|uniref:Aleurone layer morphogenesis protein n=1 Tax=Quillaja saponaria TaxID=32244 RepID=A0AAD7VM64_QUISA|nr:Aleurone layer morphogenesis protein [Quillaja saponaria]